jgi:plastocyanin
MKKLLVLLIACLALTVAACGDDDDDDGGDGAATTTEQTDTGAAPPADEGGGGGGGEAVTVDIPAIEFDPTDVTVAAGSTVTWTNSDDLPHTVTKDGGPGADFDSGNIDPGGEFEQTFDQPGTVDYVCTIHPGQAGTVTVE